MIRFENVTKQFPNGTIALENITFTIDPGEFVFVVGPSGAGKTTVLRLLLRELFPSSGKVLVDDQDLGRLRGRELPLLRRQIGAVFQDYKLIEDRTVSENVALVVDILKKTQDEINNQVREILSLVGLEEKADLFPSQLSGGELQRTTIARALAIQPKVVFADEPTGNLDEATAWEIINLLMTINKKDTTVIIATHNEEIVKSLGKRVIELEAGRVVRDTKVPKQKQKEKKETEPETTSTDEKKTDEKKKEDESREKDSAKDKVGKKKGKKEEGEA